MLLIHTAAGSGTVMSMHYCMGSLASMQIGHEEELECAKCGMKNSGCCHDDVKIVKIDNAQFVKANTDRPQFQDHFFINPVSFRPSYYTIASSNSFTITPIEFNGGPPIFLLNCNFRI
jgi:hypothetical protein